jgi:hypothetical protein
VAERIARTEGARARYDAFMARNGEDEDVVAYKWKLGSRHPAEDICDMYANADLYGLGKGVFPKDKATAQPAHPHCLCHYAPVYEPEIKGKERSYRVEKNGNAWLKNQPLSIRQAILGVKGEKEWQRGRVSWMEKADVQQDFRKKESRLLGLMLQLRAKSVFKSKRSENFVDLEVKSGRISLKINPEKQNRHIKGTKEYINGKSYLTIDLAEAQKLGDSLHGTGIILYNKNGDWKRKELISTDRLVGVDVDQQTGLESKTKSFTAHYSNTGTHIVPWRKK